MSLSRKSSGALLILPVLLLAACGLAACGFQMRGATSVPPEMARTYIAAQDQRSLFYRRLRDSLRNAGVNTVETLDEATAVFSIVSDIPGQRVLSVSARNVPREFEVFYTVAYSVETEDATLLERRVQTLTRDYTWDETQVLGKEREEELLREAIVDDLVRIVLIQLSAI
jgi:LPS-assembly lipoprotein